MEGTQSIELEGGPLDGAQQAVGVDFYCSRRSINLNSRNLVYVRTEERIGDRVVYREQEFEARLARWRKRQERTDK